MPAGTEGAQVARKMMMPKRPREITKTSITFKIPVCLHFQSNSSMAHFKGFRGAVRYADSRTETLVVSR